MTVDRVRHPEKRSRRGRWIALGIVLGLVGGLYFALRQPAEPLTAERLEEARAQWAAAGPPAYVLELELAGAVRDRRRIEVRGGAVVGMTTDGVEVPRQAWEYWTVDGLFAFLETELGNARSPQRAYGVTDPKQVVLRARFDPELGYPEFFLRHVMGGTGRDTSWTVVAFRPGPPEAG